MDNSEEHFKNGGLGSAILEWLNENNENSITVHRIGVEDHFIHKLGNQKYIKRMVVMSRNSKEGKRSMKHIELISTTQ